MPILVESGDTAKEPNVNSHKNLRIRRAVVQDVEKIVRLVNAGGPGGKARTSLPDILPASYTETFETIDASPDDELMVVDLDDEVIGTFQITYLTYLAANGRQDMQVEAVHVSAAYRGKGIGSQMMTWVIERAKSKNCRRIQLTTDKTRKDAHRFYERLGFKASHEGMKLTLG